MVGTVMDQVPFLACAALAAQLYGSKHMEASPLVAPLCLGWPQHQGQGEAWLLYHGIPSFAFGFPSVMGVVAFERPVVDASIISESFSLGLFIFGLQWQPLVAWL